MKVTRIRILLRNEKSILTLRNYGGPQMTFQMCHVFLEKKVRHYFSRQFKQPERVLDSYNQQEPVPDSDNKQERVLDSYNKREHVPDSCKWRERVSDSYKWRECVVDSYKWQEHFAHALEQIACAQAARRPSKEARCFVGRRKLTWLYLKTTIIMRLKK